MIDIFQVQDEVFSVHLHKLFRCIVRSDESVCSVKACKDKKQMVTQSQKNSFSCEHLELLTSEEICEPLQRFTVRECRY